MVFVFLLVLLCNLFAADGDGPAGTYNCSKITAEETCKATGWCVWTTLTSKCVYDECLKWVADDDQSPCVDTSYTNPNIASWVCTLYYLTDAHDCSNGSPIQTDRYCRSNVVANRRNPMEECFYYDLKALAANQTTPGNNCSGPTCKLTSDSNGKYCEPTGNPPCDEFYGAGNYEQLCNCLSLGSKSYCDLFPGCQNSSAGCLVDPCYRYTAVNFGGCDSAILPADLNGKCKDVSIDKPNPTFDGAVVGKICVSSSRNYDTINSCFYLQQTTSENNFPEFPECSVLKENEPVCVNSPILDSSGKADGDKKCTFTPIAGKYFESLDGHYCNDGNRKNGVPSPNASTLIHVPLFIALTLSVLALLV